MTIQEFSNAFDTLLNSYASKALAGDQASKQGIVLDEYEKSCFLTLAQEQLVLSYYNGKNTTLESFEKTEEIRRYLSSLVKTVKYPIVFGYYNGVDTFYLKMTDSGYDVSTAVTGDTNGIYIEVRTGKRYKYSSDHYTEVIETDTHISSSSLDVTLPNDLWFITYESAKLSSPDNTCLDGREIEVIPVTQDTFFRTKDNPFKTIGSRRAFRLDIGGNKVELVSKYSLSQYIIRYVSKLSPIILIGLPDGLSVGGQSSAATCALHDALHRPILELAVRLALQSKGIQLQ